MIQRRKKQQGAAILAAMVTVTLVATVAAGAVMHMLKETEIEAAERSRVQAQWLLRGAMSWSRLLLRQDAQSNMATDHLGEPWALPLQDTKVTDFMTAHNGVTTDASTSTDQAYLSGRMEDQQGKINLKNMVMDPTGEHAKHVSRLFENLGLMQSEFQKLQSGLTLANSGEGNAPVMPVGMPDLAWLGLTAQTIQKLLPHATLVESMTQLNLNTASVEAIWAVSQGLSLGDAKTLVSARANSPFATIADAAAALGGKSLPVGYVTTRSSNFLATGQVRMENIALAMQANLLRINQTVSARSVSTTGILAPLTAAR